MVFVSRLAKAALPYVLCFMLGFLSSCLLRKPSKAVTPSTVLNSTNIVKQMKTPVPEDFSGDLLEYYLTNQRSLK